MKFKILETPKHEKYELYIYDSTSNLYRFLTNNKKREVLTTLIYNLGETLQFIPEIIFEKTFNIKFSDTNM